MADCSIDFQGVTYNTEAMFQDAMARAKGSVNTNINYRGDKSTKEIISQDGLGDFVPVPKGSSIKATEKIKSIVAEKGIFGLRNELQKYISKLREIPSTVIAKSTVNDLDEALQKDLEVYESLMEKLQVPISELADGAGVTEAEYEAYINREDIPEAVYNKIKAFNKRHYTKDENSLFTAMRKTFKQVSPLSERVDKLIMPDGTMTKVKDVLEDVKETVFASANRWNKVFDKLPFGTGEVAKAISKQVARFVTPDNLLMKMGFQKGSIGYEIMYYAMNKGNRDTGAQNAKVNTILNDLAMSNKLNLITSWRTNTNWKNIEKHKIQFGNKEIELTGDELVSTYLTFLQDEVREDFMYDDERMLVEENEKTKKTMVHYAEFKSGDALSDASIKGRGKESVILTQEAWEQIKAEAQKDKYKELIQAKKAIFEEQFQKVKETLLILTGQELPYIEEYYPTFQYNKYKDTTYDRQKSMIDNIRYVKERKNGLKDIQINGFFNTVHNYAEATNYYSNMAIPLNNANLLFSKLKEGNVFGKDFDLIVKNYGAWLEGLTDNKDYLNYTDSEKVINKIQSAYYKGTLGWNIPVVLKQPLAAIHAYNFFQEEKYAKAFFKAYGAALDPKSRLINEMKARSPSVAPYVVSNTIASPELGKQVRMGMDMSAGAVINSGNFGKLEKAARQAGDLYLANSMNLIKRFDLAGRAALFATSKEYVTDKFGLTEAKDGDAYWEMVEEIFAQSMEDTQQTWDFMHRSGVARNPNALFRGVLMFSTQLQKHFSLLDKSLTQVVLYGRKEDYKALTSNAISILLVQSTIVAAIDMGRDFLLGYDDDDEDKRFRTLAAKTFSNNLATIPVFTPISNDLTNMVFGTSEYTRPVSVPALDLLSEFQDSMDIIGKREKYGEPVSARDKAIDLYDQIWKDYSKFMGIPLAPFKQIDAALKNME